MKKRMLQNLLILLAVLGLTILQPSENTNFQKGILIVEAAVKKPVVEKKHTVYVYQSGGGDLAYFMAGPTGYIYIKNLASNAKVTDIKSSNAELTASKRDGLNALVISQNYSYSYPPNEMPAKRGVRPGIKTTLSFKVTQGGKTYNLKCNVMFKLQTKSPFSSLKIGATDLTSKSKGLLGYSMDKTDETMKIVAKPASEIKIDKIYVSYENGTKYWRKVVKTGQNINLKNAYSIQISYEFTKTPVYYKKPTKANVSGEMPSPLHWDFVIHFI